MKTYIALIAFEVEAEEILEDKGGHFEIGYLSGEIDHMINKIINIKVPKWELKSWKPK